MKKLPALACAAIGAACFAQPADTPAWKISEQQYIDGQKREMVMDWRGARAQFEKAFETLEMHKGWGADWGARVAFSAGRAIAYTCSDYPLAIQRLELAWAREAVDLQLSPARLGNVRREIARVAYQAGNYRVAIEEYQAAEGTLGPSLMARSPLLMAEFLEEYSAAMERFGNAEGAAEIAVRAGRLRASTPPNPLMARATPTYAQVCGGPPKPQTGAGVAK